MKSVKKLIDKNNFYIFIKLSPLEYVCRILINWTRTSKLTSSGNLFMNGKRDKRNFWFPILSSAFSCWYDFCRDFCTFTSCGRFAIWWLFSPSSVWKGPFDSNANTSVSCSCLQKSNEYALFSSKLISSSFSSSIWKKIAFDWLKIAYR